MAIGSASLDAAWGGNWTFVKNAIIGANFKSYPSDNYFPASIQAVKFVDHTGDETGNYRLAPDSPFRGAGTDGKDIGADIDAIEAATAGVRTGNILHPPKILEIKPVE